MAKPEESLAALNRLQRLRATSGLDVLAKVPARLLQVEGSL
jgi:hypothetical protein